MNLMDSSTKPDDLLTEAKAVAVVQQQICKWQKNDENPHHSIKKDLKENKDFEVKSEALEGSTSSGHQLCVYIYCKLCKKNHMFGWKCNFIQLQSTCSKMY